MQNGFIVRKEANKNTITERNCNCRAKDACPLQGECQTKAVIYQAAVTNKATKEVQTYVGLTENTFKTGYLNHTSSFRNKTKRNATELSKHIWKLKDSNTLYTINWKIIKNHNHTLIKPNAVAYVCPKNLSSYATPN